LGGDAGLAGGGRGRRPSAGRPWGRGGFEIGWTTTRSRSPGRAAFQRHQLKVERAAVHFISVKIHFANGETQDVELRAVVPAGGESRVIDVEGAERVIRLVEFWYEAETARRGKRATVRLRGRG
jgi:hypothetical protein